MSFEDTAFDMSDKQSKSTKTKKAPKSLSGVHSHVKTIIPLEERIVNILTDYAKSATDFEVDILKELHKSVSELLKIVNQARVRGQLEAYHVGWSARSAEGGKKAAATRKKQFSIVQEKRKAWLDNKLKEG